MTDSDESQDVILPPIPIRAVDAELRRLGELTGLPAVLAAQARVLAMALMDCDHKETAALSRELRQVMGALMAATGGQGKATSAVDQLAARRLHRRVSGAGS